MAAPIAVLLRGKRLEVDGPEIRPGLIDVAALFDRVTDTNEPRVREAAETGAETKTALLAFC
jgi:predicted metal-dependent phosphotriesterase family hydrolase